MKKVLFLLVVMFLFSCEKEAQYCWKCMVTTTLTFPGGSSSITSPQTKCNMSTREIELFMQSNNATCSQQ